MDNSYKQYWKQYLEQYMESHSVDEVIDLVVNERKRIEKPAVTLESTEYNSRYWLNRIAS